MVRACWQNRWLCCVQAMCGEWKTLFTSLFEVLSLMNCSEKATSAVHFSLFGECVCVWFIESVSKVMETSWPTS